MSLRDQLLKSGLVDKKQAKKAERSAKKKQHQVRKGKAAEADELKRDIEKQRLEQKQRDLQLNREREQMRVEREKAFQASDIVLSNDQRDRSRQADQSYFFIADKRYVRNIEVTELQAELLARGKLAIATAGDDEYYLIDDHSCLRVMDLKPDFIVCWHREESISA